MFHTGTEFLHKNANLDTYKHTHSQYTMCNMHNLQHSLTKFSIVVKYFLHQFGFRMNLECIDRKSTSPITKVIIYTKIH
jgi:hypothetical protein